MLKLASLFLPGSTDQETVNKSIAAYSKENANFGMYTRQTICTLGIYCDDATTTCKADSSGQSAECTCKANLYSSQMTVTTCRECAPECTSDNGRQCKSGSNNLPECVCLPGYKSKDNQCKKCDFGYSGEECKDNYLLILVIVGAVLGALVVILLGTVIGVSLRSRKRKSGERAELIKDDKLEENIPPPGSLFPRIQIRTDLGQVNRATNVYDDDEEEFRRSIPQRDYDENPWYEMARKERNY
ncbi:mucin-13 [Pyxicephalus adspersus]|uniref:mucin-13 n=1 Tax=Pyxicephalus adspersus TaxID=30357 RepID=UPI003B5A2B5E